MCKYVTYSLVDGGLRVEFNWHCPWSSLARVYTIITPQLPDDGDLGVSVQWLAGMLSGNHEKSIVYLCNDFWLLHDANTG